MFCQLTVQETYFVRNQELRPGKPIESCIFYGDNLDTTLHFGYRLNDTIIAVVSVFEQEKIILENIFSHQIRGMAVLKEYQGNGIGKKLFTAMENNLYNKNINTIWFNARAIAVPFYKSLHNEIINKPFEIQDVGKHYVMYKILK